MPDYNRQQLLKKMDELKEMLNEVHINEDDDGLFAVLNIYDQMADVKRLPIDFKVEHECDNCGAKVIEHHPHLYYGGMTPYYTCDNCGHHKEGEEFGYKYTFATELRIYKEKI